MPVLPWFEMADGRVDDGSDATSRYMQFGLEALEEVSSRAMRQKNSISTFQTRDEFSDGYLLISVCI
jgi:hypothetical protein